MKKSFLFSLIAVLLVVGVGFTFAYFVSGVNLTGNGSTVQGDTSDLIEVIYDAGDSALTLNNAIPGDSASKDFTVTIRPTATEKEATYGIFIDLNQNTFVKCDDTNYNDLTNQCTKNAGEITYQITDEDGVVLASGDLTGQSGKIKILTETKTVDTETVYHYTLTITFEDTGADQNHNQNKALGGDVVVEFSEYTLVDVVKGAYQTNPEMLAYDETVDNNLRYIGANPNNYVLFNCDDYNNPNSSTCELWRIIGVFSADTHGRSGEKLVKLIRSESIGDIAWDSGNVNDWSSASLQESLNGSYLSGTNLGSGKGITSATNEMIEEVTWKLGGTASTSESNGLASHFYGYERGETVYSNHETTWEGKIGLMYPSDYGYATKGGSTTDRSTCLATALYNWDYSDCYNNDWLYDSSAIQWTLTPNSSYSSLVCLVNNYYGILGDNNAYYGHGVRPSIYLKSNIAISGGDGSESNPYTLTD